MSKLFDRYKKEITALLVLLLVVVSISTFVTYKQISSSLSNVYLNKLSVLKNSLSAHITSYFDNNEKALVTMSQSKTTLKAVEDFSNALKLLESEYKNGYDKEALKKEISEYISKVNYNVPSASKKREIDQYIPKSKNSQIIQQHYVVNNPFNAQNRYKLYASKANLSYDKVHKEYQKYFVDELKRYGYYDIFLINLDGDIIYSVFKENDFGTNLIDGVYSNSSLSDAYKNALENGGTAFSDFRPYEPSYNRPTAFMATTVYKNGEKIAVLAIQLSIDTISKAMTLNDSQAKVGLGDSGEAYLVGDDYYMRSNSRFLSKMDNPLVDELSTTIGIVKVKSSSSILALKGQSGEHLTQDYRGVDVFSSYAPIKLLNKNWAMIVEVDSEEVYSSIDKTIKSIIFMNIILTMLLLALLWFLFLRLILRPMEKAEDILAENMRLKSKEFQTSQALLDEYKKAVDISSIVSKTTPNGIITYVNDAFCEISGYTREELIGKPHNMVRHPDMPKEVFEEVWNTISRKKVWNGVIKNLKKDGGDYYVNSTISPILDEKGDIKEFISIRNDITELSNKEKQIINQTTDLTTSLPNRQKLLEDINLLDKELKLAIVQIEKFKEVNDFYGIEFGDKLLVAISSILNKTTNYNGLNVYKVSGDEFAILESDDAHMDDFSKIISNIIKYFDHNVVVIGDNSFNISVNVGMSAGERSKLFYNSEMALRKAIENNKSFVSYEHAEDVEKEYQDNIEMTVKIKDAIRNDDIVIFAQPIKANSKNKKEKFECLVRMRDNDKIISPFFFLDIAKKARLYPTITKIVIEKSFTHFKDSESEFSINLNIEDILDNEIVSFLKRKIKDYRIGHRVVLELVESEGIENFESVDTFIKEMKELGCKIAIDDFGTGYSNFEYLMRLNADFIKIDGSLIKNIDHDENAQVVVELIVDFAKRMNIQTIAEYIHSEEVYQKVLSMGIDYSQGFHLGEPEPL